MPDDDKKVKDDRMNVACSHATGMKLRLFEMKDFDGGEIKRAVPVGDPVTLKPGMNVVSREFFEKWKEQHKESPLLELLKF